MKRANVKNAIILALVLSAAIVIVFSVIMKGVRDIDMAQMAANPELKPALLENGEVPPFDPAFYQMRPLDIARTPLAARFDEPLGSEHGAFSYDAQPFGSMNRLRGGIHLGNDLNGIGGNDTDLGDPVRAVADGRVLFSGHAGSGWGKMVILAHVLPGSGDIVQSVYAHLEKNHVTAGMSVLRGDRIASVGNADGIYKAHLHLELRRSLAIHPAEGYFSSPLNREKPSDFLKANRGAGDDLLTSALEPGEIMESQGLHFE